MKLEDVVARLEKIQSNAGREMRLTIATWNPSGLSAHQSTEVEALDMGFDWTAGQVIVRPARQLTALSHEQVSDITVSVRAGGSWHVQQERKRLRAHITELEAELASLRAQLPDAAP